MYSVQRTTRNVCAQYIFTVQVHNNHSGHVYSLLSYIYIFCCYCKLLNMITLVLKGTAKAIISMKVPAGKLHLWITHLPLPLNHLRHCAKLPCSLTGFHISYLNTYVSSCHSLFESLYYTIHTPHYFLTD